MIVIVAVCLAVYFTLPETGSKTLRATVALKDPEIVEGELTARFRGGLEAVRTMPGGHAWAEVIQKTPEVDRHFAIHDGHLMHLNEADQAAWGQGGSSIITDVTFTGGAGRLRGVVEAYAEQGVTELAVMTSGPDIPGELERYVNALA
jgi:5,10-methylenetetrahydromethanopterin reductase